MDWWIFREKKRKPGFFITKKKGDAVNCHRNSEWWLVWWALRRSWEFGDLHLLIGLVAIIRSPFYPFPLDILQQIPSLLQNHLKQLIDEPSTLNFMVFKWGKKSQTIASKKNNTKTTNHPLPSAKTNIANWKITTLKRSINKLKPWPSIANCECWSH